MKSAALKNQERQYTMYAIMSHDTSIAAVDMSCSRDVTALLRKHATGRHPLTAGMVHPKVYAMETILCDGAQAEARLTAWARYLEDCGYHLHVTDQRRKSMSRLRRDDATYLAVAQHPLTTVLTTDLLASYNYTPRSDMRWIRLKVDAVHYAAIAKKAAQYGVDIGEYCLACIDHSRLRSVDLSFLLPILARQGEYRSTLNRLSLAAVTADPQTLQRHTQALLNTLQEATAVDRELISRISAIFALLNSTRHNTP